MDNRKSRVRETLVVALSKSPMLQYLGKNDPRGIQLREMLQGGELHQFPEGHAIFREGDKSDAMYVLASGTVVISLDGVDVCTLDQPGEVFGEFGALSGAVRSATVTAQTEVMCLAVSTRLPGGKASESSAEFHRLLQQAFTSILLERLRQTNEEVVELKKSLHTAENQAAFLRIDNETLTSELKAARTELREGLRGTRDGAASG